MAAAHGVGDPQAAELQRLRQAGEADEALDDDVTGGRARNGDDAKPHARRAPRAAGGRFCSLVQVSRSSTVRLKTSRPEAESGSAQK